MQQIWKVLNSGRERINAHPFFGWLTSDDVPLGSQFIFTPVMIDFIMSFADLNKWFLRYENPEGKLQESINEHTEEDATHSQLFVQNWEHLKLGDTLQWTASKGLWWLFHSRHCQSVRHFGMDVLKLAVRFPDPQVRFCMMEAIEICGDVFFEYTAPIAERLSKEQGAEHIYYGQYHRDRENGHLQSDEGCFAELELSQEQRAKAEGAVAVVYEHFLGVLDELLSFSQSAVTDYRKLQRDIDGEYRGELVPPVDGWRTEPSYPKNVKTELAHPHQRPMLAVLESRVQRLRAHRFLGWLRSAPRAAAEKLKAFAPLWGIDVVGYRDFNELVLRYPQPQTPAERIVNHLAADLATHGSLYLQDWQSLHLDMSLGWRMIDVISYYFLSEHTEVHRRNMAKVKTHAMRHDEPVVRWWLMYCLEKANETFFDATRDVALAAEADLGITLNFWAYRHGLLEATPLHEDTSGLLELPMSADEGSLIEAVIETIFDNFEAQFELSHDVAMSGLFCERSVSRQPPRMSEVVRKGPLDLVVSGHHPLREVASQAVSG